VESLHPAVSADHEAGRPFGTTFAERGAVLVGIGLGLFLAVVRAANRDGADSLTGPLDPVAFGSIYGIPGLFALAGSRRRPAMYLAAGIIAPLLAFTAFSGVALPLFIPGCMALVAYGRRAGEYQGVAPDAIVALVSVIIGLASFAALFLHQDSRCVSTTTSSECTSNALTASEAWIAIACSGAAVLLGSLLSRPRARRD
jgi:hypothetical protein